MQKLDSSFGTNKYPFFLQNISWGISKSHQSLDICLVSQHVWILGLFWDFYVLLIVIGLKRCFLESLLTWEVFLHFRWIFFTRALFFYLGGCFLGALLFDKFAPYWKFSLTWGGFYFLPIGEFFSLSTIGVSSNFLLFEGFFS